MLGMSKTFIFVLIFAFLIGYGTKSFLTSLSIIGVYAVLKIIYNILT